MQIEDYAAVLGMGAIFVSGAAVILTWISRAFWSLTFKKKEQDDEKRFKALEIKVSRLEECETKNEYFRHNFKSVTDSLLSHITTQIDHLKELIELKFKIFEEQKRNRNGK